MTLSLLYRVALHLLGIINSYHFIEALAGGNSLRTITSLLGLIFTELWLRTVEKA